MKFWLSFKMAEAKLVLKGGETFHFNDNSTPCMKMKDCISSVSCIQKKVNEKLTEIVNTEKKESNGKTNYADTMNGSGRVLPCHQLFLTMKTGLTR